MEQYNIPCVILSGGKSSRMGEKIDKSLLPFGGFETMIEYQYNKLSKIFKKVYISSKTNKFNFDANIIYDNNKEFSPLVALDSIFSKLDDEKIFIITVDTPLIQNETIQKLVNKSHDHFITLVNDGEFTHNLFGIYNKKVKVLIKEQLKNNNHKIRSLIQNTPNILVLEEKNKNQFTNINTINDYNNTNTSIR